jgi:hypothetical protein
VTLEAAPDAMGWFATNRYWRHFRLGGIEIPFRQRLMHPATRASGLSTNNR